MKITIEALPPGGEEEIIIRADQLDERIMALIQAIKSPEADTGASRFAGGGDYGQPVGGTAPVTDENTGGPDADAGRYAGMDDMESGSGRHAGGADSVRHAGGPDSGRLTAFREGGGICLVETAEIYYFESVDDRVFAYVKDDVAEVKRKLYELEERLAGDDFIRISKSMILNLSKVKRFAPYMGGRFEALLENGEKVLISRQYVPELKKVLGL